MSVKNSIKGLQKQVRRTEHDATVAAISQLMDELSAEAAGGSVVQASELNELFESAVPPLGPSCASTGETQ